MDVHKNSIDIAIAESGRYGQVRHYGKIDGTLSVLDKVVRTLINEGNRLRLAYEAGPCGYKSYRHLNVQRLKCSVVALSMIPKSSGNKLKNDRRDALMLARLHRAGELTSVYVPLVEDETIRDQTRASVDAKGDERKIRQRLLALCFAAASAIRAGCHGVRHICAGCLLSRCHTGHNRLSYRSISAP